VAIPAAAILKAASHSCRANLRSTIKVKIKGLGAETVDASGAEAHGTVITATLSTHTLLRPPALAA